MTDGSGRGRAGTRLSGGALLRAVGLEPDGPVLWGAQVASRVSGVLVVELPQPHESAPIDTSALRRWIEGVPSLRLDDRRPTVNELAGRLSGFWLPGQTVVYVGHSAKSLGGRIAALFATGLGERRPHPGGHWLRTLRGIDKARVWWAETDAPEEYADAVFTAFAQNVDLASAARLHDPTHVLPFANRETPAGERKAHGLAGFLAAEGKAVAAPARPPARRALSDLWGATRPRAAATRSSAADGGPSVRIAGRGPAEAASADGSSSTSRQARPAAAARPAPAREVVSADGLARLRTELDHLINVERPQVIARVKSARELGDLRENADYEAARNEQSFLEGRILSVRARLDTAEVADSAPNEGVAVVGSTVVVEEEGDRTTYTLVGAGEADPGRGRISYASPVGRALVGRRAGDDVVATLPGNDLRLRIIDVS
jgi:transcription elongation factor GreA